MMNYVRHPHTQVHIGMHEANDIKLLNDIMIFAQCYVCMFHAILEFDLHNAILEFPLAFLGYPRYRERLQGLGTAVSTVM